MNALLTIISTGSLIAFAAGLIITATFFDQLRRRF
jgi:hypothetical protein